MKLLFILSAYYVLLLALLGCGNLTLAEEQLNDKTSELMTEISGVKILNGRLFVDVVLKNKSSSRNIMFSEFNLCGEGGILFHDVFNVFSKGSKEDAKGIEIPYMGIEDFAGKSQEEDFIVISPGEQKNARLISQLNIKLQRDGIQ